MIQPIHVRALGAADVEDFRTIRLAALREAPEAFGSVLAIEAERPLAAFAERLATSTVVGAYHGSRIVGMAGFRPEAGPKDRHKGLVWGVHVSAPMRGRGIGTALLAAVIDSAAGVVEHLTLAVVEGQPAALALYRKAGFVPYGVEPRALKGPGGYANEILMVRLPDP